MYVARILYPVEVLGPGKRIGIWFCGCPHRCVGCSNPELWEVNEKYKISVDNVIKIIHSIADNNIVDGFTITGGEPFYQPVELHELIEEIYNISDDILVYSGYTLDEIKCNGYSLDKIAVLIDGKYISERNQGCAMRGSDNQQIYVFSEKYKLRYAEYLKSPNAIQNFTVGNSVVSVGIHKPDYEKNFEQSISKTELIKQTKEDNYV